MNILFVKYYEYFSYYAQSVYFSILNTIKIVEIARKFHKYYVYESLCSLLYNKLLFLFLVLEFLIRNLTDLLFSETLDF